MNNYEKAREILGVSSDAIEADIKTAFRKKALSCHPDKHPNDPQAAEIFLQISQAQNLLLRNLESQQILHPDDILKNQNDITINTSSATSSNSNTTSKNFTPETPKFAKSYHYESRETSPCPNQSEDTPIKKWNVYTLARFLTFFEMMIFMTYLIYFHFRIRAWPFYGTINELSRAFTKTGAIIFLCVWILYLFLEQYGNGNQKNKIIIISCVTRLISTILTLGYFIYIYIYKMGNSKMPTSDPYHSAEMQHKSTKETSRLFEIIGLLLTLNISQASLQIKMAKMEKAVDVGQLPSYV